LPDAGCAGNRVGARIERAFDDRQQRDLGRHAAPFHFRGDVKQVTAGAFAHAQHIVGVTGIPLGVPFDQRTVQIVHAEAVADALPHILFRQRSHFRIGSFCLNGDFRLRALQHIFRGDDHCLANRGGCLGWQRGGGNPGLRHFRARGG